MTRVPNFDIRIYPDSTTTPENQYESSDGVRETLRPPPQELMSRLHARLLHTHLLSSTPDRRREMDDLRDALRRSISDSFTQPPPHIADYKEKAPPKVVATRTIGRTVDGIEYEQVIYDDGSRKRKIVGGTAPISVPRSKWRAR